MNSKEINIGDQFEVKKNSILILASGVFAEGSAFKIVAMEPKTLVVEITHFVAGPPKKRPQLKNNASPSEGTILKWSESYFLSRIKGSLRKRT